MNPSGRMGGARGGSAPHHWRRGARSRLNTGLALAIGLLASVAGPPASGASGADGAGVAEAQRAILMERYIVSATRIDRNPWRYASVPGFEILSRASSDDTNWWLHAQQSGMLIENHILPAQWRPDPPVPYTLIIDYSDLKGIKEDNIHLPPVKYGAPADAFTWGPMSDSINQWVDHIQANDADTFAMNSNLFDVDTRMQAFGSISRERLLRCAPPLPRWLFMGLVGRDCGFMRESFAPVMEDYYEIGHFGRDRAIGPGTLWVSIEETKRLQDLFRNEDKKHPARFKVPPLQGLFAEAPPPPGDLLAWESEAALFLRWALVGPGRRDPFMAHAFEEFADRARREPVTEQVFSDCFGFGYAEMEKRLEAFLRVALARPTSTYVKFPDAVPEAKLSEATSDQIGRILGDWLRMQGDSLRRTNPDLGQRILNAAGRMLERAYRLDNGLPPDVEPFPEGGRSADPLRNAPYGAPVAMKPFVVSAARIHDPAMLAVFGLYENDIGDAARAREFLEAAFRSGARRPRANVVLAELRYSEAVAAPSGRDGKLSAPQAVAILEPLRPVLRPPATPEAYRLLVETWAHCDTRPPESDIDRITEGARLYPRDVELAYRSALVCARGAYTGQALELIRSALVFATTETERQHLGQLRDALAAPADAGRR